jgi:large subunit ribosomal protein L14
MIFPETILNVADNSGARSVKCIRVFNSSKSRGASLGDFILVSVQKANVSKKVKKGEVHGAIVVRVKKKIMRPTGEFLSFFENAVVLVDKKMMPLGSRIFGPVPLELRVKGYMKIISLASTII